MTAPVRYEKPSVLSQIPLDGHAVIEASAGTGKTYTLEHLIVEILLSTDTPVTEILVVTFTEKATGELRTRVRAKLAELLELRPEQSAGPDVPDERCWIIGDTERERLSKALAAFDSATISTIHAFCRGVLTEYAFANQRLFDEELADGRELFSRAFTDALREELAVGEPKELLRLWLEGGRSVEDLEDLLWKCANHAGRIEPKPDPERLASALENCRFTSKQLEKAKAEVKGKHPRVGKLDCCLDAVIEQVTAVREAKGLPAQLEAIQGLLGDDLGYCSKYFGELPEGSEAASIHACLQKLLACAPSLTASVAAAFLPAVTGRLERRKREGGQFDFQDMLSLLHESLEGPHGPALVEELRSRYRFALIDEFQDTDPIQWKIFRKLFFQSEGRCRLYLIGDPKQAIYAFRGADVQTYVAAKEELLGSGGKRVVLDCNYRSTPRLIEAYNEILDQKAEHPFFTGQEIRYDDPVKAGNPRLAAVGPDGQPAAAIQVLEVPSEDGRKGKDQLLPVLTQKIASEVRALLGPDAPLRFDADKGQGPQPIRPRDIYILARGRDDGLRAGEALRDAGIPYAFYKQEGLFQTEEAEHIQDLLDALASPDDPSKRLLAWMTPFFGLRLEDLAGAAEIGEHPLLERLQAWKKLADDRRYARLFTTVLDESGLVRRQILVEAGERALTNYQHIFELLLQELGSARRPITEIAAGLRALREGRRQPQGENGNMQRLESERDAVQILTMHVSKGLEAPVVFLLGGLNSANGSQERVFHDDRGERILWLGKAPKDVAEKADKEEAQEDERLLYVALTRAKARLYLPYFVDVREGGREPLGLTGCYRKVNDRLAAIEAAGGNRELFAWTTESESEPAAISISGLEALGKLEPDARLFAPDTATPEFERMRLRHPGYFVTSYTRMSESSGDDERDDYTADERPVVAPAEGELPGGAGTGTYLHELLAAIPPASAAASPDPESFAARPEIAELFRSFGRRHGIEARYTPHAQRLVHAALTVPLQLGTKTIPGIASAKQLLREMEFLYPVPEASHPLLSKPSPHDRGPFEVKRGFVKGFVDVLFEHEGLAYFGDWKSDSLPAFDAETIDAHVERHYRIQASLYTLALVKMLRIADEADYEARFGGLLYLFLRGLRPGGQPNEGVHFERPSWKQVVTWERELLERKDFGFGGER
jgi:exodeoxyribonuclease V beta subunit